MRLKDKVCIITGAGKGQGRAAAFLFAREGASIVVADFAEDAGRKTVEDLKKEGLLAEFVKVDVSKAKEVEEMVKFAVATYGKIDVLYNNAGISTRPMGDSGKIESVPEEAWDRNLDVNLKGVFLCCKYAIPEMKKNGIGSIINTSSGAGITGGSGSGPYFTKHPSNHPIAYSSAKSGLNSLSKSIAVGYGQYGIRCNVICPGPIDTELMAPLNLDKEDVKESVAGAIPARRIGQPEDVANAALFFASDESSWVTGQVLAVDGGFTIY